MHVIHSMERSLCIGACAWGWVCAEIGPHVQGKYETALEELARLRKRHQARQSSRSHSDSSHRCGPAAPARLARLPPSCTQQLLLLSVDLLLWSAFADQRWACAGRP